MYYKLPVKERLKYMEAFRKANSGMSYHDMVKDYNDSYEKYGNGGKKEKTKEEVKPIYVTNPNDPNLQSYQDSLNYYNKTKNILNPSYYKNPNSPVFGSSFLDKNKSNVFDKKNNIQPMYKINSVEDFPGEIKPISYDTYSEGQYYPIYKKPVQPYIYKEPKVVIPKVVAPEIKIAEPKNYNKRSWEFTPDSKVLIYKDAGGKEIGRETYSYDNKLMGKKGELFEVNENKRYGGIQRFDNGGFNNLPKRNINLNIRNKENFSPISGWNENVNWQGEKYNDVGLDFNRNNLTVGIGNYIPRNTFEKIGNINPYVNLNYDINDRTSIGANFSKDYNGISLVRKFDNGGKTKEPIVVSDKNDPRLRSYNDSLALYNLSQKAKKIFDVDPMDPTLESYNKKADALASKSKIKPTRLQLIGYSEPYKKDFDPYGMQEAWMVTYKKPVQPIVYKKESVPSQNNSSEYLEMRKSFLPSNRNVDIIESKESNKKVVPSENKTYSKRQWDFNSPSGKIMRYYDNAGKELWNETYDHYTGKLISTSKK